MKSYHFHRTLDGQACYRHAHLPDPDAGIIEWCADEQDNSPSHSNYHPSQPDRPGYDAKCSRCYLNQHHTEAEHARSIAAYKGA